MTKIFNDPKSCMFSSTCAAGRRQDPPGPGLIKTIGSLRYRPACGGPAADSSPRWRGTARWRTGGFTADRVKRQRRLRGIEKIVLSLTATAWLSCQQIW
jgi:hypothetical protein